MEIVEAIKVCDDRRLKGKFRNAVSMIQRALSLYSIEELALSFNGGKDSIVLLHLLRAGYFMHMEQQHSVNNAAADFPLRTIYFESPCAFTDINSFTYGTATQYHLKLDIIHTDFKSGLENLLINSPIRAIFLGVRIGDPTAAGQDPFSPSSSGWPPFMRVNPILDWSYSDDGFNGSFRKKKYCSPLDAFFFKDVWAFILTCKVKYCCLYDQGYTSIGSTSDTLPNALLHIHDSSGMYQFKPAYLLSDGRLERAGRIKKAHTSDNQEFISVHSNAHAEFLQRSNTLAASLIAIGEELLLGAVEDKVGPSLCRSLHSIGWSVSRTVVVRNDIDSVADEVECQSFNNDMVFIYGGVGPLHSDVTLAGVAKAFGVRVAPDEEFEENLGRILGDNYTGHRNEMACLPEGITKLLHHKRLPVPMIKCKNVIILYATDTAELNLQWDCLVELAKSEGVFPVQESYMSKHLATNFRDVEITQHLTQFCHDFPDLVIGCHRKSRIGSLIITLKGKDKERIESAVEALRGKYKPEDFSEISLL